MALTFSRPELGKPATPGLIAWRVPRSRDEALKSLNQIEAKHLQPRQAALQVDYVSISQHVMLQGRYTMFHS